MRLTCQCGKKLNVGDHLAGKLIKCPACERKLRVEPDEPEELTEPEEIDDEEERPRRRRKDDEEDEAPRRKKKRKAEPSLLPWLIGGGAGVLLLVVVVVVVVWYRNSGTTGPGGPGGGATVQLPKPDVTISMAAFYQEVKANEQAGDKYHGKVLRVEGYASGQVMGIDKSICRLVVHSEPRVSFSHDFGQAIECQVRGKTKAQAEGLIAGQQVTVQGRFDSRGTMTLTEAELVSVGADPTVAITAEELAKEFAANPEAAQGKYMGKALSIQGVITSVRVQDETAPFGWFALAGTGTHSIVCEYHSGHPGKQQFAGLRAGQKVKVKGLCMGRERVRGAPEGVKVHPDEVLAK